MSRGFLMLSLLSLLGRPLAAGPLVEALKARQSKLDAILARHPGELPPAEKDKLGRILTETLDFREMGKAALGAEWDRRSDAERTHYLKAFEDLLRASLLRKPDIYRVNDVQYGPEKLEAGAGRVLTTVRSKDATTEVEYEFLGSAGQWRIVDYKLDGVSTVRNYRSQFAKILAKSGWAGLLDRLRKRASEIAAET
ncbi:MAG TPA: ABC transporter substrate-binding protein [Vicinamibacteria bacterium]|nr:ABC transporter substrate-binding protein [Vicinamibacteria bacterium]